MCKTSMHMSAAFMGKAQLSQFILSNFPILDNSFKVVVSAMMWVWMADRECFDISASTVRLDKFWGSRAHNIFKEQLLNTVLEPR
jgi:hypothetical protein